MIAVLKQISPTAVPVAPERLSGAYWDDAISGGMALRGAAQGSFLFALLLGGCLLFSPPGGEGIVGGVSARLSRRAS